MFGEMIVGSETSEFNDDLSSIFQFAICLHRQDCVGRGPAAKTLIFSTALSELSINKLRSAGCPFGSFVRERQRRFSD